jgi:hypothetical protein
MIKLYEILVRKPEGKRSLGRCKHRQNDIKMDLTEGGRGGWIYQALDWDQWEAF